MKRTKKAAKGCCGKCAPGNCASSWTTSSGSSVVLQNQWRARPLVLLHAKSNTVYPKDLEAYIKNALVGIDADIKVVVTSCDVEIKRI